MRKSVPLLALVFAGIFSLAASLPFLTTAKARKDLYFFEAELASTSPGNVQVFYDLGRGINEPDSSTLPLKAEKDLSLYRFPLPLGTIHALRFDPIDREGIVTVAKARIVDLSGHTVRAFAPADFRAAQQVASMDVANDRLTIATTPGASDPITEIALAGPINLAVSWGAVAGSLVPLWIGIAVATVAICLLARSSRVIESARRLANWAQANPAKALLATAIAAVAVQCHPVLFFGKSFVSPNNNVYLLYDTFPTAPGYDSTDTENAMGADVGAMMWQHLYYPIIAREAIFTDGELPLWNRYDLGGVPFLGQGQSMFGDPLNWLTIAAKGATWAWDVRFLMMRVIFSFGVGLAVWLLVRYLGAALLMTVSVVFIGFFAFRLNHPAILSVCWAPWVLVAWCWLLESGTARARNLSLLALIASHWCMMTSGTIKEAYMLAACLDLAGLLLILLANAPWRDRVVKLGAAAFAGAVFVLLAAPQWITFLDALGKSHTMYEVPGTQQLSPWMLIGLFEDLFYRQLRADEAHYEPSVNFVILFGVLWALACLRDHCRQRRFLAVLFATFVPLALVFGAVPSAWIVRLPFIANIIHIDNTFSCPLLILTAVLAGFGVASALRQLREPGWMVNYAFFFLLLAALTTLYFGSTTNVPKSLFFQGYTPALFIAILACPVGIWLAARQQQSGAMAAIAIGGLVLLLWRHGQYLATPFDAYVLNPKVRVDLSARSPVIDFVNSRNQEPARTVGLGYDLFPGYNQALGWESIYGVDAVRNRYLDELAVVTPLKKVLYWVGGPVAQEDIGPLLPIQDLLNVRYYLATHRASSRDLPGRRQLASLDLDVFESPTAWPRAFFTNAVTSYPAAQDFVHLATSAGPRPFAAVQERDLNATPSGMRQLSRNVAGRSSSPAYDYRLTANATRFTVAATEPGVIVLSESYYPRDFRVTLNGEPVPYFRVNHAFKGIYVDHPGIYHVTFRYWPEYLTLSLWLCLTGVLLGISAPLLEGAWHRRRIPTA